MGGDEGMSDKEKAILTYIKAYKRRNDGNSPSFREIMSACEISSTSYVKFLLGKLEARGEIQCKGQRFICVAGGHWGAKAS
jgi:SOS-response transcriptional repressor LexA